MVAPSLRPLGLHVVDSVTLVCGMAQNCAITYAYSIGPTPSRSPRLAMSPSGGRHTHASPLEWEQRCWIVPWQRDDAHHTADDLDLHEHGLDKGPSCPRTQIFCGPNFPAVLPEAL